MPLEGWETSTGLKDDFTGTVTNPRFTADATGKALGGNTFLEWEVVPDDGSDVQSVKFSCGSGYVAINNGASVKHQDKADKAPHFSSGIGILMERCAKNEVEGAFGEAIHPFLVGKNWRDAGIWDKMRFHFQIKRKEYKDKDTGEKKESANLLPDQFLGIAGGATIVPAQTAKPTTATAASASPAPVPPTPAAPAAPPAAPTAAPVTAPVDTTNSAAAPAADAAAYEVNAYIKSLGLTPMQGVKLKALAKAHATAATFEDPALEITGMENEPAMLAVAEGHMFAHLKA